MDQTSHLLAKFFTKNVKYATNDESPYSIPFKLDGDALNLLIKSIIIEKHKTLDEFGNENENETHLTKLKAALDDTEFDFFINEEFIESTLEAFLQNNPQIKTESVIEIEYIERNPPPEPIDTITTEDWICSIRAANENLILLGSYDHTVQLWNRSGELLQTLRGHSGAVKAIAWLSTHLNDDESKDNDRKLRFISGSHDQSILIWDYNESSKTVDKTTKCIGHKESVECLDISDDKTKFISGSWDKMLKLWSIVDDDLPEENMSNKKSKSNIATSTKTPIITLGGHMENISSCKWIDDKKVCTASWDHSIKLWDVFVGQETQTLKSINKIFLSIDHSRVNNLIAAGLNDPFIRIYDPRSSEGSIIKMTLSSHQGWCSAVTWSKTNENLLLSGSYDSVGKLWDIRNQKASLFDLVGHEDKILCVDWSVPSLLLTGSADNTFKMFNSNQPN